MSYDNPVQNWIRLKDTQRFLASGMMPHENWYNEHYKHLTMYANVLRVTVDWDQRLLPIMEQLISDYEEIGYYSLKDYQKVVEGLIKLMDDHDMASLFKGLNI
jgi:hypothetical protein